MDKQTINKASISLVLEQVLERILCFLTENVIVVYMINNKSESYLEPLSGIEAWKQNVNLIDNDHFRTNT